MSESDNYDPSNAPQIPPRPIIVCDRCRRPFDARRDMPRERFDSFRCEFCGERNNPGDIICNRNQVTAFHWQSHKKDRSDTLYIIKGPDNLVKIGVTNQLERRMASMRTNSPVQLEVERAFEVANPREIESKLHKRLDDINSHGEWFALDGRDLSTFVESVSIVVDKYGKEQ